MNKSICGVCGKKMERIPIPANERGPFLMVRGQMTPLGRADIAVVQQAAKKFRDGGAEVLEVVLDQWGCLECETIHSYWYRKDGKEGDLFRVTKDRQHGKGVPLRSIGGGLKDLN